MVETCKCKEVGILENPPLEYKGKTVYFPADKANILIDIFQGPVAN